MREVISWEISSEVDRLRLHFSKGLLILNNLDSKMHEAKVVVGIASLCSLAAILATLIVIPQLYIQINEVNSRVMDGVQVTLISLMRFIRLSFCLGLPCQHRLCLDRPDGSPNQRYAPQPSPRESIRFHFPPSKASIRRRRRAGRKRRRRRIALSMCLPTSTTDLPSRPTWPTRTSGIARRERRKRTARKSGAARTTRPTMPSTIQHLPKVPSWAPRQPWRSRTSRTPRKRRTAWTCRIFVNYKQICFLD